MADKKPSPARQDKAILEQMLSAVLPDAAPQLPKQESAPQQEPAFGVQNTFVFNYEETKAEVKAKAEETIRNIVDHVMPAEMVSNTYVQDKMRQDVNVLTDLYMQQEMNNVMHRSIVENVSRGNTAPRLYEVFGQLSDKAQAIDKQIMSTEQSIRKTYLDLKYEITEKMTEEPMSADPSKALPEAGNTAILSPRQLITNAKERHKEALRDKMKSQSVGDTDFEEIK